MDWYYWVLLGLIVSLLAFVLALSFILARSLYHPKRLTNLEARNKEIERSPGLIEEYETWSETKYIVKSRHGYELAVYHIPSPTPSRNYVVIAHGYSYTHYGAAKYARMMRELGFNIVTFDERFHGDSGGKNCTMGYFEKHDLYDVVTDTFSRFEDDIFLGTYGESMGGAAVLLEQVFDERVKFVAADCTFASLDKLLVYQLKRKTGMPPFPFIAIAGLIFRLATGAKLASIKPVEALKHLKVPCFLAHGEEDTFIPAHNSQILYDACPSEKTLFIGKNHAKHTDASRYNLHEYREALADFLKNKVKVPGL